MYIYIYIYIHPTCHADLERNTNAEARLQNSYTSSPEDLFTDLTNPATGTQIPNIAESSDAIDLGQVSKGFQLSFFACRVNKYLQRPLNQSCPW